MNFLLRSRVIKTSDESFDALSVNGKTIYAGKVKLNKQS